MLNVKNVAVFWTGRSGMDSVSAITYHTSTMLITHFEPNALCKDIYIAMAANKAVKVALKERDHK